MSAVLSATSSMEVADSNLYTVIPASRSAATVSLLTTLAASTRSASVPTTASVL